MAVVDQRKDSGKRCLQTADETHAQAGRANERLEPLQFAARSPLGSRTVQPEDQQEHQDDQKLQQSLQAKRQLQRLAKDA